MFLEQGSYISDSHYSYNYGRIRCIFFGTDKLIWIKYTLIIIILATIIGVLLLMPLRLNIESNKITLHRLIGSINIPFKDIIELKAIPNSETAYSIRIFGSGGLFGYLGKFRNKNLGNYTMYATNLNELILVRTNRKTYVFSCKNRDEFIESFQKNKNSLFPFSDGIFNSVNSIFRD